MISPVAADRIDPNSRARIEKDGPLEQVTFAYADGTSETVDIWHQAGRACQRIISGDAEVVLQPLERLETQRRENAHGTYRFYAVYGVPDPRGDAPKKCSFRTFTNDDDRAAGFNRAENVRQIPPGDPSCQRVYGRREDAESINRGIDDHGYLQRARSVGAQRQLFDLLCHAIRTNPIAQHLYGHAANASAPAA